jgi:signal peptidase I
MLKKQLDYKKILKTIGEYIVTIAIGITLALLIQYFFVERVVVSGSSMEPTISDGQKFFADKITAKIDGGYERYDVVVIYSQFRGGEYLIKRVIGLPGERIRIDEEGNIYINGELLDEPVKYDTIEYPGRALEEIQLQDDEYFVMGDNRNDSADSRFEEVGNIKLQDILGKIHLK